MQRYATEILADDFVFLEGPRWHDGRLWLSDIWDHTVYAIDEDGAREPIVRVESRPSGLGFLPDGTPLVVSMTDRRVCRIVDGKLEPHADLSTLIDAEINDMVVDARGRAYVGNMGYDLFADAPPSRAEITLIDPDGDARHVAHDLDFPNGMAIRDGGHELLVAESFGHRVTAFSIDDDGGLNNKRTLVELPEQIPDGICLDQAGNVWVAGAMGGLFSQVSPEGQVIAEIDVKPRAAIACQLGGTGGRTLFCLTYAGGIEELSKGLPGARIETVQVEVPAAGSP